MLKLSSHFFAFCLAVALAFTLPITTARAQSNPGSDAQATIERLGERAMSAIANKSMSKDQKSAEFRKLLSEGFDMETAARFAAGRHWRELSDAQRREYLKLYEDMIIRVYSARFDSYKGQKFRVNGNRIDESGDVVVTSQIIGHGAPIDVAWRVRQKGKQMRVIDVIVEGVSMAMTQRNDFASVIQRGGNNIGALLTYLRQGGTSDIK